jgi:hypothetical protein
MAPKRKLKAIWPTPVPNDPAMQKLTTAFETMDITELSKPPPVKRLALTYGEEVQEIMEDWCVSQGIPFPQEYNGFGAALDKERQDIFAAEMKRLDDEEKAQAAAPAGEKPPFGTPAFWAWARKRKLEKEKEAAEAAAAKKK